MLFRLFKRKIQIEDPLAEVTAHLKILGYDLTPYGASVSSRKMQAGYTSAEVASHMALTTMALDIKNVGDDIDKLTRFVPHAMAILDVLAAHRDKGLIRETMWKKFATAVLRIATVDEQQVSWIEKVLSDPLAAKERLANSRIDYAKRYAS